MPVSIRLVLGAVELLAGLGLFGVTAYAVAARRTEIGIRMALGATPAGVIRLVVARTSLLVAAGVLLGVGASLWASKFVGALVYGLAIWSHIGSGSSLIALANTKYLTNVL